MKCEHHDDYIKMLDGVKEHVDRVEKRVMDKIKDTDRNVDRNEEKLEGLRDEVDTQGKDQRETEIWVKNLYKRFDDLTVQMQGVVGKLDTLLSSMTIVKKDTDVNTEFSQRGKKLVYEIIKWVLLLALGYALNSK